MQTPIMSSLTVLAIQVPLENRGILVNMVSEIFGTVNLILKLKGYHHLFSKPIYFITTHFPWRSLWFNMYAPSQRLCSFSHPSVTSCCLLVPICPQWVFFFLYKKILKADCKVAFPFFHFLCVLVCVWGGNGRSVLCLILNHELATATVQGRTLRKKISKKIIQKN